LLQLLVQPNDEWESSVAFLDSSDFLSADSRYDDVLYVRNIQTEAAHEMVPGL